MGLLSDLRYGVLSLARKPGFTLVALLTLALGIGANTAIFSVVNGVLLRPLPFKDPDRLVLLWEGRPHSGWDQLPASYPNFSDLREQARSFEGMAAFFSFADTAFNLSPGEQPERAQAAYVTGNRCEQLGVRPQVGRSFRTQDDRPGAARVAILSDGLWRRRFGADPAMVGNSIPLDGQSTLVVGVMPRGFTFPRYP